MADINSSVRYAQPGSPGIFADKIGWFEYSNFSAANPFQNNATYSVINTISNPPGYSVTFDLTISQTSEGGYTGVGPLQTPVYPFAVFGNTAYVGVSGNIDIYTLSDPTASATTVVTLDNIRVFDNNNIPVLNYDIIAADGESTNSSESWIVYTNGTPWTILQILPPVIDNGTQIDITGQGTNTIQYTGTTEDDPPTIIVSTTSPTTVIATLVTESGRQGVVFGIMIPSTSYNGGNGNYICC